MLIPSCYYYPELVSHIAVRMHDHKPLLTTCTLPAVNGPHSESFPCSALRPPSMYGTCAPVKITRESSQRGVGRGAVCRGKKKMKS